MTASDVKIGSREEGKANRPNELEEILLGYYIKLRLGSQESCIYSEIEQVRQGKRINRNFGIKSLLSQNWRACVYTKIWEKNAGI